MNLSRVTQLSVEPGAERRTLFFWLLTPRLPQEMFAELTDLVKFITVCPCHGPSPGHWNGDLEYYLLWGNACGISLKGKASCRRLKTKPHFVFI